MNEGMSEVAGLRAVLWVVCGLVMLCVYYASRYAHRKILGGLLGLAVLAILTKLLRLW